jgi:superfamily II DNA or RNA helicase
VPSPPSFPILSEHLAPLPEPLACLLAPGAAAAPRAVAARAARALLDLEPLAAVTPPWPAWLAPHQVPAAERLRVIVARYGGALLADAVGLGKSYVALAVALALGEPFALVAPAVLVEQWRALLAQHATQAPILTHESLSASPIRLTAYPTIRLLLVDEAHRFRNPGTNRYRALARLAVGRKVLLVTATPVHNRVADLFHVFRLFLRDHDLAALGVPSLRRAAHGEAPALTLTAVAARLAVARSRDRARAGYGDAAGPLPLTFPARAAGSVVRAGTAPAALLTELVRRVVRLEAGREAAGLLRLMLLSQLASSLPAFRASLGRYEAFLDLAHAAAAEGRALDARAFQRLFPRTDTDDLQLSFFPVLLPTGAVEVSEREHAVVRRLRELAISHEDPKADALERLLARRDHKTIVFVQARATLRYLLRRLTGSGQGMRIAAVLGQTGLLGREPARRNEVLRAFAPRAQGAPAPAAALTTDVLLATDLLSEGLNLQDASRVIHYDLPWSPARLAQRVGRIDRAGSPHTSVTTVTFAPPRPLAAALAIERRLAHKTRAQARAGAGPHALDWCDRLQQLARAAAAPPRAWTVAAGPEDAAILVVRIGDVTTALVVTGEDVRDDPVRATELLEQAARAPDAATSLDRSRLERAIQRAAPLVRARLGAVAAARWRAEDRDRLSRRLIPWVLTAARRAAQRREHAELVRLDALVSRLALGMTAGEELLLEDLLARRGPVAARDVVAWHERLPPLAPGPEVPRVALVAAVLLRARSPGPG